jgi:ferritin
MKRVLSIKIEKSLIQQIKEFCQGHGLKQGFFVEKAIKSQLEREEMIEDIIDLKEFGSQEKTAVPFDAYLKKRRS